MTPELQNLSLTKLPFLLLPMLPLAIAPLPLPYSRLSQSSRRIPFHPLHARRVCRACYSHYKMSLDQLKAIRRHHPLLMTIARVRSSGHRLHTPMYLTREMECDRKPRPDIVGTNWAKTRPPCRRPHPTPVTCLSRSMRK